MAKKSTTDRELEELRAENRRLQAENKQLRQHTPDRATAKKPRVQRWPRQLGAVTCIIIAVALLLAGNLLFWAGNTVVKSDRYAATVTPVIKDPEVQKAVATYATKQLYSNVDATKIITSALPPRADFLAPTLASQLESHTDEALQKVLANPRFQDKWNVAQVRAHDRFITVAEQYGNDGRIDLSEAYRELSGELKGTRLAFLADKPLPSKVGSITLLEGDGLAALQRVITHIDVWRTLALLAFVGFAALGVWLSRQRRRTVITLGVFTTIGLFFTLVSIRATVELLANKVQPEYSIGVQHAAKIMLHPLVVQTATIMALFILVVIIAWLSGPSRAATVIKDRIADLLQGRLHAALFGGREFGLTRWLGAHKRQAQWTITALVAASSLLVRLTPGTLLVCVIVLLVLVLLVEILAAPVTKTNKRVT